MVWPFPQTGGLKEHVIISVEDEGEEREEVGEEGEEVGEEVKKRTI